MHLARRISPSIQIESETLDDKQNLIDKCGKTAAKLVEVGCVKVVIIWDLRPAWPDTDTKPCLVREREAILDSLGDANVPDQAVHLVCIEQELEAWLLADERAVSDVLSTSAHPISVRRRRNVERIKNPKGVLNRLFKEHRGRRYVDRYHAEEIVLAMPDLSRLYRIDSFRRFERAISSN